jgi:hypothetical protein
MQEERSLVIYVSREGEPTRRVSNEQQLLGTIQVCSTVTCMLHGHIG